MREIKASTAYGRRLVESSHNYEGDTLRDIYASFSRAKEDAYNRCKAECRNSNGSNFHITSYNTFGFCVSWVLENGNIRYETPNNSYLILI